MSGSGPRLVVVIILEKIHVYRNDSGSSRRVWSEFRAMWDGIDLKLCGMKMLK